MLNKEFYNCSKTCGVHSGPNVREHKQKQKQKQNSNIENILYFPVGNLNEVT